MFTLWVCLALTPVNTCGVWQVLDFYNQADCSNYIVARREEGFQEFAFCAPTLVRT